jgi:hypothetical protein
MTETLYEELAVAVPAAGDRDPGKTIYTFDDRETVDLDRAAGSPSGSLVAPVSDPTLDPGRTEHTGTVETIDRDRHIAQVGSILFDGDLYGVLASKTVGLKDRGRTITTKASETIDVDRPERGGWSTLLRPTDDLYGALARPTTSGLDRGRTQITEATETIDFDRSPIGLGL